MQKYNIKRKEWYSISTAMYHIYTPTKPASESEDTSSYKTEPSTPQTSSVIYLFMSLKNPKITWYWRLRPNSEPYKSTCRNIYLSEHPLFIWITPNTQIQSKLTIPQLWNLTTKIQVKIIQINKHTIMLAPRLHRTGTTKNILEYRQR